MRDFSQVKGGAWPKWPSGKYASGFFYVRLSFLIGVVTYNWAFTRYDRRTDRSVRLVCQTSRTDRWDRLAKPPTSVNQINVAC